MEKIRLKEILKVVEGKVITLEHMITEGEVALKRKS
jgi:hypothetical protein